MTAKIFKTYKEQRDLLQSRGLIIKHPRSFNNIMQRDDYYNIINGYKKYFIATTSPETYIPETTFEQLYALYTFDQEIRSLFMNVLLKIEKHLKSLIAYHFSEVYGYDNSIYLNRQNFNLSTKNNARHTDKMLYKINW